MRDFVPAIQEWMGGKDVQRMRLIGRKLRMAVMILTILWTVIVPTADILAATIKTMAADTIELTAKEELEENTDLSNSYKQLEEKYQREKDFSRLVIYTLIFIIAILVVININIIVYYRRKSEDDLEDNLEETKSDIKPIQKTETKKIEKKEEEVSVKPEKTPVKEKKTSAKVEVWNKLEVLDFNDEE